MQFIHQRQFFLRIRVKLRCSRKRAQPCSRAQLCLILWRCVNRLRRCFHDPRQPALRLGCILRRRFLAQPLHLIGKALLLHTDHNLLGLFQPTHLGVKRQPRLQRRTPRCRRMRVIQHVIEVELAIDRLPVLILRIERGFHLIVLYVRLAVGGYILLGHIKLEVSIELTQLFFGFAQRHFYLGRIGECLTDKLPVLLAQRHGNRRIAIEPHQITCMIEPEPLAITENNLLGRDHRRIAGMLRQERVTEKLFCLNHRFFLPGNKGFARHYRRVLEAVLTVISRGCRCCFVFIHDVTLPQTV